MLSGQLLSELTKLNRTEKLRIVQLLVNELALEEMSVLQIGPQYEISRLSMRSRRPIPYKRCSTSEE